MIASQQVKCMRAVELLERKVASDGVAMAPVEAGYALNLAGVYQDCVTRDWAMQTYRRATRLAGKERVQDTWFDVNSLSDHGILLHAVRAALVADVIVVSVYAAEELPLDLYLWFEAWLPRRSSRVGALTALIGVAEPPDSRFARTLEYLQAVARKARLDFVPQARQRAVASPGSSMDAPMDVIAEPSSATARRLQTLYGRQRGAYHHWGLNV
jgi:hypothetical protein